MDPSFKFFLVLLVLLGVASLFVPIVTNPNPVDCNNYPDGTGGYYSKCKDEHISMYKKWTLPKGVPETRPRTF
jgi:hypothetical protein